MKKLEYIKITKDDYFMELARTQSGLSTDIRRPIGSIIVKDGVVVGYGSNQATVRWSWLQKWHKTHCFRKILGIKTHNYYWLCSGCALFRNHAEARAIRDTGLQKMSGDVTMYLHGHDYCCDTCLKKVNEFGISKIYISK